MQSSHGMGVGMKYPGSTGGEIFNYYTDDANKNTAEGDYSTTVGYNNKSVGDYYLTSGSGNTITYTGANTVTGGLVAGSNNQVIAYQGASICLGDNNRTYGNNQVCIGYDNNALGSISSQSICVGRGLKVDNNKLKTKVVLGTYNTDTIASSSNASKLQVVIGGGDSSSGGHQHNAMEVYNGLNGSYKSCTIFPEEFALSNYTTANKAYVNAIDPPADPDAITTNEQTLATLGSLDAFKAVLNSMHLQRRESLLTGQLTELTTGTPYDLESTFSITIPNWANRLRLGCQFGSYGETQGYVEFGLVAGSVTYTALNSTSGSLFAANLSYNSGVLTVNSCMRLQESDDTWDPTTTKFALISISAYGTAIF